jgi:hypothetical protein
MIISHKYRFIFIKTPKTAGTSIEVFLSQHCGDNDILTTIYPQVEPHVARNYMGYWNPLREILYFRGQRMGMILKKCLARQKFSNHVSAKVVQLRISRKIWNEYFKFCVERNPWDKTLSHYGMINYRAGGNITLDDYFSAGKFCVNYPIYTDKAGELIVDRVIKYESLMDELGEVFGALGIPFNGTLGVKAKAEYRNDRRPYQEVFSDKQRRIIEEVFAKEIELHGYNF